MQGKKIEQTHPYKRKVTHTEYPNCKKEIKEGGYTRVLSKVISDNRHTLTKKEVEKKDNFLEANEKYMQRVIAPNILPLWGGEFFDTFFNIFIA